jgi:hypothetical protein
LTRAESSHTVQVKTPTKEGEIMELTKIAASNCKDGDCPTVYRTDRGTIGVQGYVLDRATPDGEALVEIPAELLMEAAHALGG